MCWLLLLTKICAFVWELVSDRDQCAKKLALASDIIPLLGYALLIFLYTNGAAVPEGVIKLLIAVVIVDAALYWVHEAIYKRCKGEKS